MAGHTIPEPGSGAAILQMIRPRPAETSLEFEAEGITGPLTEQADILEQIDVQTQAEGVERRAETEAELTRQTRIDALAAEQEFERQGGQAGVEFREKQRLRARGRKSGETGTFVQPAAEAAAGPAPGQPGFVDLLGQFTKRRPTRVVTKTPFARETLGRIEAGKTREVQALALAQEKGAQRAAEESSYLAGVASNLEAQEQQQTELANERATEARDQQEKMNQSIAALRSGTIDTARFYRNKGTGAKIAMGIGIALGAFGATARGGRNAALDIVNGAIERDIQDQLETRKTKQFVFGEQRGLYDSMLQEFGDREQALAATRRAYMERVRVDVQAIASLSRSDEKKAQAQGLLGQLDQQIAQMDADFQRQTRRVVLGGASKAERIFEETFAKEAAKRLAAGTEAGIIPGVDPKLLAKISDRIVREKIPILIETAKAVRDRIKPFSDEPIAGLGFFERAVPGSVLGLFAEAGVKSAAESLENRQTVQELKNTLIRLTAGLTQSPSEAERLQKEIEGAGTEAELKRTGRRLFRKMDNQFDALLLPVGGRKSQAGQMILQSIGFFPTQQQSIVEQEPV